VRSEERQPITDRYLTRSDIAKILKVSPKQAGRLMGLMPFVQIGKKLRRVAIDDFEAWCLARRANPTGKAARGNRGITQQISRTERSPFSMPRTGAVFDAVRAASLKRGQD
jgi:hypothetical protein